MYTKLLVTLGSILLVVAAEHVIKKFWREHVGRQVLLERHAPALNALTPEHLADADWSYSGPLGQLTLRFEQDGQLVIDGSGEKQAGQWEIKNGMLIAHIPGANQPHQAVFKKTTDELAGVSPVGLNPKFWTATRIR
jgi:hypothetical protein